MRRYVAFIIYFLRHKMWVTYYCIREGLWWRGITHDLSKLRPTEFIPYARYLFNPDGTRAQPIDSNRCFEPSQEGDPVKAAFTSAWILHHKRNDHHWEWWTLPYDDSDFSVLPMSPDARLEMLCDWRGTRKALGFEGEPLEWYAHNRRNLRLHQDTREWIERQLGFVAEEGR